MNESERAHIIVEGNVQGVFFRANTRNAAKLLGLKGWVRNLPDGRVEIMAEGTPGKMADFVRWCRKGPPLSRVEGIEVDWEEPTGEFTCFEIRQ
ncbi:MAG: acylphosphatase [candidate division WOR-3 bacterium]|nr:MAG: acylphosphatase [candidate division WOR-3 bacterium]